MAVIATSATSITALYKHYHSDKSQFYPAVAGATEYEEEFYAVTVHSDYVANSNGQTIIRFVKNVAGDYVSYDLRDPITTASPAAISGSTVGDLDRLGDYIFYSNYEDEVKMIKSRRSAGDTSGNIVYKAGVPDPNAVKIVNQCDDTANWTFSANGGVGSCDLDRTPSHRLEGDAALRMTQEVSGETSTLTLALPSELNLKKFADGSTSTGTDFISFNVYRYSKGSIKNLRVSFSSGDWTNYYFVPIAAEDNDDLKDNDENATWAQWDFQQNTIMAEWGINPYDNQFFRVRIRKRWFARVGSPGGWSAINSVRIEMEADSQASSTNPAQISIDDIKLLKTPPIATDYRIQWASFEEEEVNSTYGWLSDTATLTRCDFNRQLTKEGVSCLIVSGGRTTAQLASAIIKFDSAMDFVTFPDGVTANTACVLSLNCAFKGILNAAYPNITWNLFTAPKFRFSDSAGAKRTIRFGMGASLRGGGLKKQVQFNPEGGTYWGSSGGAIDWTDIRKIEIWGPRYNGSATNSYYIDDLNLQFPKAGKIVNAFEPLDLIALDAVDTWADTSLKNYGWVVDLATDVAEFFLRNTKYKTFGFGHAKYPDYEHSSVGIAGCTLTTNGSKPFGLTIQRDKEAFGGDIGINLDEYKIPLLLWPPEWNWAEDKFGLVKFETIPSNLNDRFRIWVASPKPEQVSEIKIRFHGNNGFGNADLNNFYEYTITGQELYNKMVSNKKEDDENRKKIQAMIDGTNDLNKNSLLWYANFFSHAYSGQQIQDLLRTTVRFIGKDRGGWPSATFEWNKKDMLLVRDGSGTTPDWSDIRGHTFEVSGAGNEATVCLDNLTMKNAGALNGEYYYKVVVEDEEGHLSNSSEPSLKVLVDNKDVVLTDIFAPNSGEQRRVEGKKIFRTGGTSAEWRHVGDLAVTKTTYNDNKFEEDLGVALPEDTFPPPKAKIIKAIGNNMYYGNVVTRLGETFPYRVYRSEPYCAYRVNDFSCIDVPETMGKGVTGIEQYYNHIVVWTADSMWSTTMGLGTPPVLRSSKGCIAKRSIAVSERGLIWLSRDGLMLGNISQVDETFFLPVNPLFDGYTEDELENSIGFIKDNYYYLFYDQDTRKGICCYLPDRLFSELTGTADSTGPFDVHSVSLWRGSTDADKIYYGRSNGEIYTMFDGATDNGTAIWTHLRTKDFSEPGIQYDKYLAASYWSIASLHTVTYTPNLTPGVYRNQTAVDTMPTISATTTAFRSFVGKAIQGDYGQFIGVELKGTNRSKLAHITMKIEPKPDTEYFND